MKLRFSKPPTSGGHVLLMTIVVAGTIAVAIGAYLNVILSQNNMTVRSQAWNLCMPVVEAGLEEALAHINNPGVTNLATSQWNWNSSSNAFIKQRTIGDSYCVVVIQTNLVNGPTITSTGYVPAPATVGTGNNPFLAAAMPATEVAYISRTVRLLTTHEPLFHKALVVKNSIDLNGNNVTIDSYDSSVGPYGGANIGDKGDVTIDNDVVGLV